MATKVERVIWSNIIEDDEEWKDGFSEWCEDNGIEETEDNFQDYINESIRIWLDDERCNLNQECGNILAIADLGLWDGRHQGYKVIRKGKLNGIFSVGTDCDDVSLFCDRYNVRGRYTHHDGTNFILFREIREGVNIGSLLERIYNGEEIDSKTLNRYTRSLRPKVAKVYGW